MGNGDGVSALLGTCVTINMLMGSGFLALPGVFQKTGLIFSCVTLTVVGFTMYITCCWEGRAVLRGQYKLSSPKVPEVTEALRLFCGDFASSSYLFILSVSFVGAVWAYAILFAESLSSDFPIIYSQVECVNGDISSSICFSRYLLNLAIFATVTAPLSLMAVKDQAYFQAFVTVIIMTLIAIMCGTAGYAFSLGQMEHCFPNSYLQPDNVQSTTGTSAYTIIHAYFACISACVFSVYLNGCVPVVAGALRSKGDLDWVLGSAIAVACTFYGSLYIVAGCFGAHIDPLSNLNWRGFRWPVVGGVIDPMEADMPASASARLIELFVVLFPALVVLSVYPLITKIIANNILEAVYGAEAVALATVDGDVDMDGSAESSELDVIIPRPTVYSSDFSYQQKQTESLVRQQSESVCSINSNHALSRTRARDMLIIRVLVNLTPILCAAFIPDFLSIIVYVGGISVLICLVYPAVLSIASSKAMGNYVSMIHCDRYLPPSGDLLEHPTLQMGVLIAGGLLSLVIIVMSIL